MKKRYTFRSLLIGIIAVSAFGAGVLLLSGNTGVGVSLLAALLALIFVENILFRRAWHEQTVVDSTVRAARDRARAISEIANKLGATLDYNKVLDAVMDVGVLCMREASPDARLMSMVLLWEKDHLRVASKRNMPWRDEVVTIPGQQGILGAALQSAEPVFASSIAKDPEMTYFAAFYGAKSIMVIPLRAHYENYGLLVFGSSQPNAFSEAEVELLTAISTQGSIALQNAVLYQTLLKEKERLLEVEEEARKKLARDLHDGPTQSVSAIAMRTNYIRMLVQRSLASNTPNAQNMPNAVEELQKVEDLAQQTVKEIRSMLFTLRPLVLETQGLTAALEQFRQKMKDTHQLEVTLEIQQGAQDLIDSAAQTALFYIVEEAVNNARKHARASMHWVRLFRRDRNLILEIEDNGLGFDLEAVDSNYESRGSLGMVNMRERADLAKGTLNIESARGRGTKITVTVPLKTVNGTSQGARRTQALELPTTNGQPRRSNGRSDDGH